MARYGSGGWVVVSQPKGCGSEPEPPWPIHKDIRIPKTWKMSDQSCSHRKRAKNEKSSQMSRKNSCCDWFFARWVNTNGLNRNVCFQLPQIGNIELCWCFASSVRLGDTVTHVTLAANQIAYSLWRVLLVQCFHMSCLLDLPTFQSQERIPFLQRSCETGNFQFKGVAVAL